MKKSKSSNPRFDSKKLLLALALLLPEPPALVVAIAVGKTNDGESFPAKPNLVKPVPLSITTAGVPIEAMMRVVGVLGGRGGLAIWAARGNFGWGATRDTAMQAYTYSAAWWYVPLVYIPSTHPSR